MDSDAELGIANAKASVPPEADHILDPSFAQLQREAMEREVKAQGVTLDPSALHPAHVIPGAAPFPEPEDARTRGESLSLDAWLALRGCRLVDAEGEDVGEIAEVYYDEASREPEWIGIELDGLLGSHRVVAPVYGTYVFGEIVSVPYARDLVVGSGAGEALITADHERALYKRYALPYSRAHSPTGLPDGSSQRATALDGGAFLSDTGASDFARLIVPEAGADVSSEPIFLADVATQGASPSRARIATIVAILIVGGLALAALIRMRQPN